VLVAGEDQLDQWLMAHPSELFTRPPEPAVINPSNAFILDPHVACAAYEKPLTYDDATVLVRRPRRTVFVSSCRTTSCGFAVASAGATRRNPRSLGGQGRAGTQGRPAHRTNGEFRIVLDDDTLVGTVIKGGRMGWSIRARCTCTKGGPTASTNSISITGAP
jgi:DEAD/DEAH box helicase domain-containing protein